MNVRMRSLVALFAGAITSVGAWADEASVDKPGSATSVPGAENTLRSGLAVGKEVPSFFVRAVTGPQMNRSVCFVCRNGDRPVMMVVMRQIEAGTAALLKAIDEQVDGRRADGLRAFGVLLSDDPAKTSPLLQTVSFDGRLSIPLGVGPEVLADREILAIDPAASVTIVAYRDRKVVWTAALRTSELRDKETCQRRIRGIVERVETLAVDGERGPSGP